MNTNTLSILPVRLGAVPIVNHYLKELDIESLIRENVAHDSRDKIPVYKTLSIILRNIILERHPLYEIGEWALKRNLIHHSLSDCMTDDRIGRALDRLFRSDRATLITKAVLKAINTYNISTDRVHNDSTSVTLYGDYKGYADTKASKPKRGFNKDFRPDLKQLVYSLTVSADGAIPLYFKVWDGNVTDDTTHMRNWMSLRNLLGKSNFTYVADSKFCVRESMLFVDSEGGRFVTVLPETRSEITRFKEWIQTHTPQWRESINMENPRGKMLPRKIFWTFDSPFCSSEGFRIVWIKSSLKQIEDEQRRTSRITSSEEELDKLSKKTYRNKDKLKKVIESVLGTYKTEAYFDWKISVTFEEEYKQTKRGRPNDKTEFRKIVKQSYHFTWCQNVNQILYESRYDGLFPLITNIQNDSAANILEMYKFQPRLEKRFEQLKTVYSVAPIFLKNPERIEALLTLYFMAILITSLIERTVRLSMAKHEIESIPIYPEERLCKSPTADKILQLFEDIRLQYITIEENVIKTVPDQLSDIQKEVLNHLSIDEHNFFKNSR